jgi:hypothetical protein
MPVNGIPKLIMEWIPEERRKRGRSRKTWMEGVQEAMTTRNLEQDQWRNREKWRLVSGRRRKLLQNPIDTQIIIFNLDALFNSSYPYANFLVTKFVTHDVSV